MMMISEDIYIDEEPLRGPFWEPEKRGMSLAMGLFADMQMMQESKLLLVDKTAPNTPTNNEFSFMSPSKTPKKTENESMLVDERIEANPDLKIVSKFSVATKLKA